MVTGSFADDWPEWRGAGRRGEYKESGVLDKFPAGGLKVRWRVPIHAGYTGPAVAGGRVFVTDFRMMAPGEGPAPTAEMYNDRRATGLVGVERAIALDQATGKVIWSRDWDADYTGIMQSYAIGPRATPTVDGDRIYIQTTMGALVCLNAATGAVLWRKDYKSEFGLKIPVWGMTSPALVDGPRVVAVTGGKEGSLMAFDKRNGKLLWKAVPVSEGGPGYSAPYLVESDAVMVKLAGHLAVSKERIAVMGNTFGNSFEFYNFPIRRSGNSNVLVPAAYYRHKNLEIIPFVAAAMVTAFSKIGIIRYLPPVFLLSLSSMYGSR